MTSALHSQVLSLPNGWGPRQNSRVCGHFQETLPWGCHPLALESRHGNLCTQCRGRFWAMKPWGSSGGASTLLPIDCHKWISLWKRTNCTIVRPAKAGPVQQPGVWGMLITVLSESIWWTSPYHCSITNTLICPPPDGFQAGQRLTNQL